MCVCVYVCVYVRMYVCMQACMYACMYACMHACMCVCMHVRMHACMHAYTRLHMHACMYICMHSRMHVCTHTHTHTHTHLEGSWQASHIRRVAWLVVSRGRGKGVSMGIIEGESRCRIWDGMGDPPTWSETGKPSESTPAGTAMPVCVCVCVCVNMDPHYIVTGTHHKL